MKIYTSYYSKVSDLRQNEIEPVCISAGAPDFFKGLTYRKLAPRKDMLYGKMTDAEYRVAYAEILSKLEPQKVVQELTEIADGKNIALCCYEGTKKLETSFCHRQIVAKWLWDTLKIEVEEFDTKRHGLMKQQNLFD